MSIGEHLHVHHAGHFVQEQARTLHVIVQVVGDQEETLHTRRYHHQGHWYAQNGVEDAEDFATRGQGRDVAVADGGEHSAAEEHGLAERPIGLHCQVCDRWNASIVGLHNACDERFQLGVC